MLNNEGAARELRFAARVSCDSKGSECQCGIHTAEAASALRSRKTERAAKEKPTPISQFFLAPAAPPPPGPSAERESGSCLLLCAGLPECPGDAVRRSPLRASVPPWGERRSARCRRALPLPQRSLAPTLLSPHAATAPSTGSPASRRVRYGRHSRGVKPQYRAKSRNTGCDNLAPLIGSQPHGLHAVIVMWRGALCVL